MATLRKSPFPGMDPYLERHWRDVHTALITYARDRLSSTLPDNLLARMEERVYVETAGLPSRVVMPDVKIVEDRAAVPASPATSSGVAVAEPVVLHLDAEPVTEPYIVITDLDGNRIVTVIEFLSPANKEEGAGRDAYLKKRKELLASDANLVEIDLVRSGEWLSLLRPYHVPQQYRTTYRACVRRDTRRDRAELYPITLRQKLPTIRIPLRATDEDVPLDLQAIVEQAWRNGRYDRTDYGKPCDPPLAGEDAAWAAQLL
jgi:hypothetical protein